MKENTTQAPAVEERLAVGPVADNLLKALRAFEQTKQYYFQALTDTLGEEYAQERFGKDYPIFEPVTTLFEDRLRDVITEWAAKFPNVNTI